LIRLQPTVRLSLARYRNQPIFDTMQMWADWDPRGCIGLADLAEVLKLYDQDGRDGRQ
jgi:hypothetical protein